MSRMEQNGNELLLKYTIRGIIAAFAHDVEEKTGRPLKTFKWPNKLIYFHLINQRADLIYKTRKQNELEGNYEDYTEVIPCVQMHEVDYVECPCAPKSRCTWMKSVTPMPDFVGHMPTSVTSLDSFDQYHYVPWTHFVHRLNLPGPAKRGWLYTMQTIKNEVWLYTYINTEDKIKARGVKIAGVPVDPMEMFLYPICGEPIKTPCDILDLDFIIEKRLVNTLYDMTFKKLVTLNSGTRMGDTKNDDRNAETATDPRF